MISFEIDAPTNHTMTEIIMPSYAGFWGEQAGAYSLLTNKSSLEKSLRRVMRRPQMRKLNAVMKALNGAAAGGTATKTFKQIDDSAITHPMSVGELGGRRTVSTVTAINAATTAAQEAAIDAILDGDFGPTYPHDTSGNGGGAF